MKIMDMCYIYTTEYYPGVKKNEIMNFPGKWIEFKKKTTLSRVTQD